MSQAKPATSLHTAREGNANHLNELPVPVKINTQDQKAAFQTSAQLERHVHRTNQLCTQYAFRRKPRRLTTTCSSRPSEPSLQTDAREPSCAQPV